MVGEPTTARRWTSPLLPGRRRQEVRQRSAKPPPPVQIRAAPPIPTLMNSGTCRLRLIRGRWRLQSKTVHLAKPPLLDRFDSLAVRRIDDVRVDAECRRDARVPELLLRDLARHLEVVQER